MAQNRRRESPNRNQSRPAQENTARRRSRSNASGRRVYDQAQDARRASSQRRGSPQGYQEQTIDFANGSVRYEQPRRADNSIQFPRQGKQMSGSAGQNGAGNANLGDSLTLQAVASAVVGGVAMSGGKGSVYMSIAGALIMSLVGRIIYFANIPNAFQTFVSGIIIIAAIAMSSIYAFQQRKAQLKGGASRG